MNIETIARFMAIARAHVAEGLPEFDSAYEAALAEINSECKHCGGLITLVDGEWQHVSTLPNLHL